VYQQRVGKAKVDESKKVSKSPSQNIATSFRILKKGRRKLGKRSTQTGRIGKEDKEKKGYKQTHSISRYVCVKYRRWSRRPSTSEKCQKNKAKRNTGRKILLTHSQKKNDDAGKGAEGGGGGWLGGGWGKGGWGGGGGGGVGSNRFAPNREGAHLPRGSLHQNRSVAIGMKTRKNSEN